MSPHRPNNNSELRLPVEFISVGLLFRSAEDSYSPTPNVRALSLSTSPIADYNNASPDAFGYRDYLTFGTLTTLTIRHITWLPILQICSCPHLSTLSVEDCEMDNSLDPYKQDLKPLAFNLRSFLRVAHHRRLDCSPRSLPQLGIHRRRKSNLERNGDKAFQRVKQLVIVDLLESSDITDITHLFNHLPELQTLEIQKNTPNSSVDIISIIRAIPTLEWLVDALRHTLSAIKSQSVLQDLELELTIGRIPMHFSNLPFDEWRQLSDVVDSHPTAFPASARSSSKFTFNYAPI
ncbi:hypothetical protein BJ165DRAFT_1610178 [Panaeolus papilionaceus]|nr:hypothetical protein BJ165DRAFT_1610178 [Panaeolus papilionaceus]